LARYLVTGGCGFIGSHLVDALVAAGHDVRILDDLSTGKRENVPDMNDVVIGDVSNPDVIAKAMSGMDGCFHLAAIASVQRSNEEWALTHRVNLTGAVNVFDAARNANPAGPVPVVYASSAAVYGDNPAVPLVEDAEKRPLTAYGADKLGCEQHARCRKCSRCADNRLPVFQYLRPAPGPGFALFGCDLDFCRSPCVG